MYPISKITSAEKEMFINEIACWGAGGDEGPQVDRKLFASPEKLLRLWNSNKQYLFDKFNNQLILEKTIVADNDFEIHNKIDSLLNGYWPTFSNINTLLYGTATGYGDYGSLFNVKTWATNKYEGSDFELYGVKFFRGMKPMKALTKVIDLFRQHNVALPDLFAETSTFLEEFRLQHSRILNLKSQPVTLCLSIHPLDYTTMSDNDGSWNSCMSWAEPGDYRQGTVEMMNSDSVVIVYIKSDNDADFPWGTWNNKRWRQLFIVDRETAIIGSTQYPYHNDAVSQIALDWLRDIIGKQYFDEEVYHISYGRSHSQRNIIAKTIDGLPHFEFDFSTRYYYNDLSHGDHKGYVNTTFSSFRAKYGGYINYSGDSECMCCGDALPKHDQAHYSPDTLFCLKCAAKLGLELYCEDCNERVNAADMKFSLDGGAVVCEDCYYDYIDMLLEKRRQ